MTERIGGILGEGEPIPGKCMDCRQPLVLERLTVVLAKQCSDIARARGEEPLTTGDVARCDDCSAAFQSQATASSVRQTAVDAPRWQRLIDARIAVRHGETGSDAALSVYHSLPPDFRERYSGDLDRWLDGVTADAHSAKSKGGKGRKTWEA